MIRRTPSEAYAKSLANGFVADEAQRAAVNLLDACSRSLNAGESPAGVYLWGRVGRGKTWLMDIFKSSLTVPVRRQHHHHFMKWIHGRLFALTGAVDPLASVAAQLADEVKALCLDEFYVTDIGDAMILGRLVLELIERGVTLVITSNQPPTDLYAHGHHRERMLPAIAALENRLRVVAVNGVTDHRLHPGELLQRYWTMDNLQAFQQAYEDQAGSAKTDLPLTLGSRSIDVNSRSDEVLWCDYNQLCEAALAADEYIALCDRYRAIFLSGVPCMDSDTASTQVAIGTEDADDGWLMADRTLPPLSVKDNGVRRFIALVDECYDRNVPLWIAAEVGIDSLYPDSGYLAFAFRRTQSRLKEMQFRRYGAPTHEQ